jgi:hypothetical protein
VFDARIGRDKQGETEEQREQLGSGVDLLRNPLPSPFLPVVFCSWTDEIRSVQDLERAGLEGSVPRTPFLDTDGRVFLHDGIPIDTQTCDAMRGLESGEGADGGFSGLLIRARFGVLVSSL